MFRMFSCFRQMLLKKKREESLIILVVFLLVTSLSAGCWRYSFSGSTLSSHIKTIAVPLFDNQTVEYGLADRLTDDLTDAFLADNNLKVVGVDRADSAIRGTIVDYNRTAFTYDENEQVKEYVVHIYVQVSYEDRKKKEVIWEERRMEGWGTYRAEDEEEELGQERAVAKLVEDIVNKTIAGW